VSDWLADARERLLALRAASAAGALDPDAYERERGRIERSLGERLLEAGALETLAAARGAAARNARPIAPRPSGLLSIGIIGFVVVLAIAGYARTGSPALAFGAPRLVAASTAPVAGGAAEAPDGAASGIGPEQFAAMVESLATRLAGRPDDVEGWTMLARSYSVLGRFAEAVPAYRRASTLRPDDAALLADWADAAAAAQGKVDHAEPAELIARALAIDPKQPKALALAGTALYERGDFAGAIGRWRAILEQLPPGSPDAVQIEASIADASAKRDATARTAGAAAPPPPSAAASTSARSAAVPAAAAIVGTVSLAPAAAATARPGDTVFVFARDAAGGRMPLAVQRATVADLPLAFRLDDTMGPMPTARLSQASQVVVGARVSRSGNALPQPGDLTGEAAKPVAPGASGVAVVIGGSMAR
jgi:cytochrome c-type biogenesis protein CcmH